MDGDDSAAIVSPHQDYAICNLEPRGYVQANAKLIAASPELLSALIDLVDACDGNYRELTDIAKAVISRATGEAE